MTERICGTGKFLAGVKSDGMMDCENSENDRLLFAECCYRILVSTVTIIV